MARLLSVDWDYFFPIPSNRDAQTTSLFDWGHREAPFFMGSDIWIIREAAFRLAGRERPDVNDQWRTFWRQFRFSPETFLYYGESHSWAVSDMIADQVTEVWNFDAHHDLSYSPAAFQDAVEGKYDCGSWMVHYAKQGIPVHVRYPRWMDPKRDGRPAMSQIFDMKTDRRSDWRELPEFDLVFVCRSGAWVPPWADHKYSEFVDSCPVRRRLDLGPMLGWPSTPRDYSDEAVEAHVREVRSFRFEVANAE